MLISNLFLPNRKDCISNYTFDPSLSSTFKNNTCQELTNCTSCSNTNSCSMTITYADETQVKGRVYKDLMSISNQTSDIYFAAITQDVNGRFASNLTDGILGLSYDTLKTNDVPNFMNQIIKGLAIKDLFSMCTGYEGGSFVLGAIVDDFHTGDILYTPIVTKGYYSVSMTKIQILNFQKSYSIDTSQYEAFVDSGTTLIILPFNVYDAIMFNLQNLCASDSVLKNLLCEKENIFNTTDKCIHFDSNVFSKLPDLRFQFRGETPNSVFELTIPPKYYMRYMPSTEPDYDFCGNFGISYLMNYDYIILGDVFMRSFYVVFDRENQRIGLAYSQNCGGSIKTPRSSPIAIVGIGLSFGIVFLGALAMFLIIYFKNKRDRYQHVNLHRNNLNINDPL